MRKNTKKKFVPYIEAKNEPMPRKNAILLLIRPFLPRIFLLPLSNQQPKPPRRASLRAPKEACIVNNNTSTNVASAASLMERKHKTSAKPMARKQLCDGSAMIRRHASPEDGDMTLKIAERFFHILFVFAAN